MVISFIIFKKWIGNYFDPSRIFLGKLPNIYWYWLLKCQDFMLFFVKCDGKLNIIVFWFG